MLLVYHSKAIAKISQELSCLHEARAANGATQGEAQ